MTDIASILRCPVSGQSLRSIDADETIETHAAIAAGVLTHLDGSPARAAFDAFLQTDDGRIIYPILDQILILLSDFALVGDEGRRALASRLTSSTTIAVMRFYDEVGWQRTDRKVFYDGDINEDRRPVSARYIRDCHLRVNHHLPKRGRYLLDIASGPVQYDEYLTYSDGFDARICCDVSFEALRSASGRIGGKGIFIQCDITNIPLKDQAVDAFVCLHTIYHLPPEKQLVAFRELERVTRAGGGGVVVYSWGDHSWGTTLSGPKRALLRAPGRFRKTLRAFMPAVALTWLRRHRQPDAAAVQPQVSPMVAASTYCFHAHSFRWYRSNVATGGHWTLRVWRTPGVDFLKRYIAEGAAGRWFLDMLYRVEERFPALFGRIGQYPLLVFRKSDRAT